MNCCQRIPSVSMGYVGCMCVAAFVFEHTILLNSIYCNHINQRSISIYNVLYTRTKLSRFMIMKGSIIDSAEFCLNRVDEVSYGSVHFERDTRRKVIGS